MDRLRPELFPRLRALFEQAVDLPDHERRAFCARECGADAELLAALESMLASDAAGDVEGDPLDPEQLARFFGTVDGCTLAGFRLRSVLGHGGMGTVYAAEQENPHRTVALKILNVGFHEPERLRRFQLEAEVLGRLQHPSIAQVYSSGVASLGSATGIEVPYMAMELVENACELAGYARKHELDVRRRIELLQEATRALQHAHERGVVHRDIKSANLLVDQSGRLKVIDFGIALAERDDAMTRTGSVVGTLSTMAPEQFAGDRVDARADVYALGAVLYELLTSRPALELGGIPLADAAARVRDETPVKATRLCPELPAQLDWVLQRALEKDPDRRYPSAAALGAELQRVLDDEPVEARPPSRVYAARLFVRRNRSFVSAVAAIILALSAGLGLTAWGLVRARRAEADSELRLQQRDELNGFLQGLLSAPMAAEQGRDVRVVDVLDQAARDLERGAELQPQQEWEQRRTLAASYSSLGLWERAFEQLERMDACAAGARRSVREQRAHVGAWVTALVELGRLDGARERAQTLMSSQREGSEGDHDRAFGRFLLGQVQVASFEFGAACETLAPLVRAWREEDGERLAEALSTLAQALQGDGRIDEALEIAQEGLTLREGQFGPQHPSTSVARNDLGLLLIARGQFERAAGLFEQQLALHHASLGAAHPWVLQWRVNYAVANAKAGKGEIAREEMKQVLRAAAEAYGEEHTTYLSMLAAQAGMHFLLGDLRASEDAYMGWVEVARRVHGEGHLELQRQARVVSILKLRQGRAQEALDYHAAEMDRMAEAVGETEVVGRMRADHRDLEAMAEGADPNASAASSGQ